MEYAIIRVKRRIDSSAAESLVVNVKKAKTEDENPSENVVERAGFLKTVGDAGDAHHLMKEFLQHGKLLSGKVDHRNFPRPVTEDPSESKPKRIKLIDLDDKHKLLATDEPSDQITCNDQVMDSAFVYDLYLWRTTAPVDGNLDHLSAFPSEYRDLVADDESDIDKFNDDNSDSNSESNWRNDYPDDEDDLVAAGGYASSYDEENGSKSGDTDSEDEEQHKNESESELQKIKRKYAKILKMMKHESSGVSYDNIFK